MGEGKNMVMNAECKLCNLNKCRAGTHGRYAEWTRQQDTVLVSANCF